MEIVLAVVSLALAVSGHPAVINLYNKYTAGSSLSRQLGGAFAESVKRFRKTHPGCLKHKAVYYRQLVKDHETQFLHLYRYEDAYNYLVKELLGGHKDRAALIAEFNNYFVQAISLRERKELFNFLQECKATSDRIKLRKLTFSPPYLDTYIDHPKLKNYHQFLQSYHGENCSGKVIINGMGGVGKTTISQKIYWYLHETGSEDYDYIGWLVYSGNWKDSVLATNWTGELKNAGYNDILEFLGNNRVLIFVDNVFNSLTCDCSMADMYGLRNLVITSRRTDFPFNSFHLELLDKDDAARLFIHYYCFEEKDKELLAKQLKESDIYWNVIKEIVSLAGCHTMTIEILAKQAREYFYGPDRMQSFMQALVSQGFNLTGLVNVIKDSEEVEELLIDHLTKVFNWRGLSEGQFGILRNFTILADSPIDVDAIGWRKGFYPKDWRKLVSAGWILRNKGAYSVHRMIKEVIKKAKGPIQIEECRKLIRILAEIMAIDEKQSFIDIKMYFQHAKSVSDHFALTHNNDPDYAELIFHFYANYINIDEREYAVHGISNAVAIKKQIFDCTDDESAKDPLRYDLARAYNSLGYASIGGADSVEKAIPILEQGLAMLCDIKSSDTERIMLLKAKILSNHGAAFLGSARYVPRDKQRCCYESAFKWHTKAHKIREDYYNTDPENPDYKMAVATSKVTLGVDCFRLGDQEQALAYHKEALEYKRQVVGGVNESVAISLNYCGGTLCAIAREKSRREAKVLARKALSYLEEAAPVMKEIGNKKQLEYIRDNIAAAKKILGGG